MSVLSLSKKQQGFTLIEVIVAITILAASIGLITKLSSGAIRSSAISRNYLQAVTFAQSKLTEASLSKLKEGTENGEFPEDSEYRWEVEISLHKKEDDELVELYKIDVKVFFKNYGETEKNVTLSTLKVNLSKKNELF